MTTQTKPSLWKRFWAWVFRKYTLESEQWQLNVQYQRNAKMLESTTQTTSEEPLHTQEMTMHHKPNVSDILGDGRTRTTRRTIAKPRDIIHTPNLRSSEELVNLDPSFEQYDIYDINTYPKFQRAQGAGHPWYNILPHSYDPLTYELSKTEKSDADPKNPRCVNFFERFPAHLIPKLFLTDWSNNIGRDRFGAPYNPWFATGVQGRGDLRRWGPNIATDAIVFIEGKNQTSIVVVVREDDKRSLAIPGGWVHMETRSSDTFVPVENPQQTASRELDEETNVKLDPNAFTIAMELYPCWQEPRLTDNAWIYTNIAYATIPEAVTQSWAWNLCDDVEGGTYGTSVVPLNERTLSRFYYHHADLIRIAAHHGNIHIPRR